MNATISDRDGRIDMIGGMASLLGVKASRERIIGYVEATADVPYDLLAAAIKRVILTWRYPDMPKPGDIRAAVDAELDDRERLLSAPPSEGPHYVCTACEDSGWVFVAGRTDTKQPTVRRCPCYTTNPRLVAPKRFSEDA